MIPHKFYDDASQVGYNYEPAYLLDENHTYHFFNKEIEMRNVYSVSEIKKGIGPGFNKTPEEICANAKPTSKYFQADPNQVKIDWENKAIEGRDFGTRVHGIIEYAMNGMQYEKSAFEIMVRNKFQKIFEAIKKQGTYYNELPIIVPLARKMPGDEYIGLNSFKKDRPNDYIQLVRDTRFKLFDTGVGGTLDLPVIDWANKRFFIHDFKTDNEIKGPDKDFPKRCLPPFQYIIECELEIYSFQVCIYALMLKAILPDFTFIPEKSSIIHFSKVTNEFKVYLIKNRVKEAKVLINKFFKLEDEQQQQIKRK